MIDAEKLLGKLVGEVVGKSGSWGHSKKSVLGGLGSGSGLMTLIGLGVGAYEILKQQSSQNTSASAPPPPPGGGTFAGSPPPPPPSASSAPQAPPISPAPVPNPTPVPQAMQAGQSAALSEQTAVRLIRVMVAAAHADGAMDAEEERAVLEKLRGADVSQEEKMFLLDELHRPCRVEDLVEGVSDPGLAKTMYILAFAAINVDTEAERAWLDRLAAGLGLSKDLQRFIEETN